MSNGATHCSTWNNEDAQKGESTHQALAIQEIVFGTKLGEQTYACG
ncbi:hypothetical protein KKH43_06720 [Patescibacteria group bacterium]|nr:hypothetical protein [Patescibacteria group bacterium]